MYDKTKYPKSIAEGSFAEKKFYEAAVKRNFTAYKTDLETDQYDHVDYTIEKQINNTVCKRSVEVKGLKRRNRNDDDFDDTIVWIEYKNVNGGTGWTFAKAQLFVFKLKYSFLVASAEEVRQLLQKLKDDNKLSSDIKMTNPDIDNLVYQKYTRYGNKEIIMMVHRSDIENLKSTKHWK